MTEITREEIAELRRLCAEATPGPFAVEYDNDTGASDEGFWEWWEVGGGKFYDEVDASLYAAARKWLPPLLDIAERQRRRSHKGDAAMTEITREEIDRVVNDLKSLDPWNDAGWPEKALRGVTMIWRLASELAERQASNAREPVVPKIDIDGVVRDVAELPDRTSPAGHDDYMLVSERELRAILLAHALDASVSDARGWRPIETAPRDRRILLGKIVGHPARDTALWWAVAGWNNWNDGVEPAGLAEPNVWCELPSKADLPTPPADEAKI